jgi:hypothetical protein
MPKDPYQAFKKVADRLKVTEATVRHWTKEGQLRATDIAIGRGIADADLADFVLSHQTAPKRPQAGLNGQAPGGDAQCQS